MSNLRNSEEKIMSLEKASKPLQEWMSEYCCPHDRVTVSWDTVHLLSEEIGIPIKYNKNKED